MIHKIPFQKIQAVSFYKDRHFLDVHIQNWAVNIQHTFDRFKKNPKEQTFKWQNKGKFQVWEPSRGCYY